MAPPAAAGLAVRMHIEQADLADAEKLRACYEVYLAAQRVDEPGGPWFTERAFDGWLTFGWDGNPRIAVNEAIGYTVSGQPVTGYRLDAAAVPGG